MAVETVNGAVKKLSDPGHWAQVSALPQRSVSDGAFLGVVEREPIILQLSVMERGLLAERY